MTAKKLLSVLKEHGIQATRMPLGCGDAFVRTAKSSSGRTADLYLDGDKVTVWTNDAGVVGVVSVPVADLDGLIALVTGTQGERRMTASEFESEFNILCNKYMIAHSVALEDAEIVVAVKAHDLAEVERCLRENF